MDHVSVHRSVNKTSINQSLEVAQPSKQRENFLIHNGFKKRIPDHKTAKPHISGHFTPHVILKETKTSFKQHWECYIKTSRKLEKYAAVKSQFSRELYLDQVTKYNDRANLTRLRISAHRLEIETGRYKKILRENRVCPWCELVLDAKFIENEDHLTNVCDLYAPYRQKLLSKLNLIYPSPNLFSTSTNFLQIISTSQSTPDDKQIHAARLIARFLTNCLRSREHFLDSLKAPRICPQ